MVVGIPLPSLALRAKKIEGQARAGSVVRRKDDQGILTQSKLDQCVLDPSDAVIHVCDHVDEVLLPIFVSTVHTPRSRVQRTVRQVHREVGEKRFVLVRLDEINQVIRDDR